MLAVASVDIEALLARLAAMEAGVGALEAEVARNATPTLPTQHPPTPRTPNRLEQCTPSGGIP